jgi:hypothetical protein
MDQADIRTSVTSSDLWWAASAAGSWPISEVAAPLIKVRLTGRSGLDSLSRNFPQCGWNPRAIRTIYFPDTS